MVLPTFIKNFCRIKSKHDARKKFDYQEVFNI